MTRSSALCLAAALLLAPLGLARAGVSLLLQGPGTVSPGQAFFVELFVEGLDSTDLAGFDIDVAFDPALIDFQGYALGSELTSPTDGQSDLSQGETAPGLVNLAEVSLLLDLSGQPDAFSLGTLDFIAIAPGTSPLMLSYVDLSDGFGDPISGATLVDGSLTVTVPVPVPVPGTLALLLPALGLALAGARRVRRISTDLPTRLERIGLGPSPPRIRRGSLAIRNP